MSSWTDDLSQDVQFSQRSVSYFNEETSTFQKHSTWSAKILINSVELMICDQQAIQFAKMRMIDQDSSADQELH